MSLIEKYKALGWTFKIDQWVFPHNGDIDDEYLVTSPRVKEPFKVYIRVPNGVPSDSDAVWDHLNEDQLLHIEGRTYAQSIWEKSGYKFKNKIIDAISAGHDRVIINLKDIR